MQKMKNDNPLLLHVDFLKRWTYGFGWTLACWLSRENRTRALDEQESCRLL